MATDLLQRSHNESSHLNPRTGDLISPQSEADLPPPHASQLPAETTIGGAFAQTVQQGGSETILLVEDETFVRRVAAEVLESAGYRVVIASTATEALQACRACSEPVDLLIADVVLPGMSGRALATHVETLHSRARILLMSGYPEQLVLCELSAMNRKYLAKPFSAQSLLTKVRETLDTAPLALRAQA